MQPYPYEIEQRMQRYYQSLSEKDRRGYSPKGWRSKARICSRRYAAIEVLKLGWGGKSYISCLLKCDDESMQLGLRELDDLEALNRNGIRRRGGDRKPTLASLEGIDSAFLQVIETHTAGAPMDAQVKWTHLTRREISQLLKHEGINVSVSIVDQLLNKHNYRKRKAQKCISTGTNPQRNQQFETIEHLKQQYKEAGNPVISIGTKKGVHR